MKPTLPLYLPQRTPAQLAASLHHTLAQNPAPLGRGIRLFVYGLLAQNPPFRFITCTPATLPGHTRSFHLADSLNRGIPHAPGLTLGLQPAAAGACHGLTYLLAGPEAETALQAVWQQEMLVPFYTPTWLTHQGQPLLVMLTDPASPALWQPLPQADTVRILHTATGPAGTNRQYLTDVATAFAAHNLPDPYLQNLLARGNN